jgi:hypothetical protein
MATPEAMQTIPTPDGMPGATPPPPGDSFGNTTDFPDPFASPSNFLDHLRSLPIANLSTVWQHFLARSIRVKANNKYVKVTVSAWLDRMDSLMVRLNYIKYILSANCYLPRAVLVVPSASIQTTSTLWNTS